MLCKAIQATMKEGKLGTLVQVCIPLHWRWLVKNVSSTWHNIVLINTHSPKKPCLQYHVPLFDGALITLRSHTVLLYPHCIGVGIVYLRSKRMVIKYCVYKFVPPAIPVPKLCALWLLLVASWFCWVLCHYDSVWDSNCGHWELVFVLKICKRLCNAFRHRKKQRTLSCAWGC